MALFKMSKTVIKNLFRKPATAMYPVKPRVYYPNTRGSIDIDINSCSFCTLCDKKCPTGAIEVDRENKTWTILRTRCIACGACVDYCPKKCLAMNNYYTAPVAVKEKDVFAPDARVSDNAANN